MKRIAVLAISACVSGFGTAQAADMDFERELGLIVSGVVDKWAGVQFIDGYDSVVGLEPTEASDTVFASGGEGMVSLPLAENLSIQSDVKYEYNSYAFENPSANDVVGPRYSYQGAVHVSWRDPTAGLLGIVGGFGTSNFSIPGDTDFRFVGGEAQFYAGNLTFYVQGGYVDFEPDIATVSTPQASLSGLGDGYFGRGVFRWFVTPDSRLQLEGTYLNADYAASGFESMEAFSVKARYDFMLPVLPIVGGLPVFIAYRGTFRDDCGQVDFNIIDTNFSDSFGVDDHTVMVGTSYSFTGDRLTIDRQGATLDTPDFNYSCQASRIENIPG